MSDFVDSVVDFIRVRQLNIALAGLLTLGYLVYQYWDLLLKVKEDELDDDIRPKCSRSRSRSRSMSRMRNYNDYNSKRRGCSRRGRRRYSDYSS